MLLLRGHLQRECPPFVTGQDEQHRVPRAKNGGGAEKRHHGLRIPPDRGEQCQARQTGRERQRKKGRRLFQITPRRSVLGQRQ